MIVVYFFSYKLYFIRMKDLIKKIKFNVVVLFTLFALASPCFSQSIKKGDTAPDFSITLSTGETVKLSDYKGTALLLHFWATWCPPCRLELPEMENLYKKITTEDAKLKFLAVCISDTEKNRETFMSENNYTFTGGLDSDNSIGFKYRIQGVPTSILISSDGKIEKVVVGMMSSSQLKEFVKDYVSF